MSGFNGFCSTGHLAGDVLCWTVIGIIFLSMYLLPWSVAGYRDHPQAGRIFLVNFFLGWTVIGWIVAGVWAIGPVEPRAGRGPAATPPAPPSALAGHAVLVRARWDPEARLWTAASDDLPGLAVQAPSHDELMARLEAALPGLLTAERAAPRPEGGAAEIPVLVISEHVLRLRSPV